MKQFMFPNCSLCGLSCHGKAEGSKSVWEQVVSPAPWGVRFGIDPACETLGYATARGISAAGAVAEALPFAAKVFDYALVVTTICFVDNARAMLREIARVLRPGGELVIGFLDRDSVLGQDYVSHREENVFYRSATFYSAKDVETLLTESGFSRLIWVQTLSKPLSEIVEIEPISGGSGRGAFLVVRAQK